MPDTWRAGPVRAVIFDVDGTLYRQSPLRRAMALRLLRACLREPATAVRTVRVLQAYRHGQEAMRGATDSGDLAAGQLAYASRAAGVDVDGVRRIVERWMDREPLPLLARYVRPGLLPLLAALRGAGVKLGVLSDYPAEAKLAAMGVGGAFECVLCAQSAEVGAFKPDPRGILRMLERLGVAAGDALYVGDRVEVDAAAAQAAGVACAIITTEPTPPGAAYLSVTGFPELQGILARSLVGLPTAERTSP